MKRPFRKAIALLCPLLALLIASPVQAAPKHKIEVDPDDFGAYLLVFFRDETHSVHFALSSDGYTFTALNDANPVLLGKNLAEQKGIRDPFIARGPDGFYMALTDLHIFAKREGLRSTEWERDGREYGWGNNRALVLLKSKDLINWKHVVYRIDKAFPEMGDIGCAWAPEMFFDKKKGKMLVYFTMRIKNGSNRIYWAYANKDFTKFETKPQPLGFDSQLGGSCIDADITLYDGKYHVFVVDNGIRQAVSKKLTEGYVYQGDQIVPDEGAVEAPTVWKRIGTDTYVLMYDNFHPTPNEMAFRETTDFKTFKPLGRFNAGVMKTTNFTNAKHGAVIPLTKWEAERLAKHWKLEKY